MMANESPVVKLGQKMVRGGNARARNNEKPQWMSTGASRIGQAVRRERSIDPCLDYNAGSDTFNLCEGVWHG